MFHSRQFRARVMSPFYALTSHLMMSPWTISVHFHPSRYPTDGEFDSDTRLTPTYSMESNPSESTYQMYSMQLDPSEPSYPLVIRLSSDSSAFLLLARHHPPSVGLGSFAPVLYPAGVGMPGVEDMEMMHPMASKTDTFRSTDDWHSTCQAKRKDNPFCW